MKKIITLTITCIIVSILFASCRSNMSIAKRHYTNGYYIAYSKGKHRSPANEEKIVQAKTKHAVYSAKAPVEQNNVSEYYIQNSSVNNEAVVTSNKKIQSKIFLPSRPKEILNQTTGTKNLIIQTKHNFPEAKVVDDGTGRDGLSLFWIVILVILILWAIGYFAGGFGLGNPDKPFIVNSSNTTYLMVTSNFISENY